MAMNFIFAVVGFGGFGFLGLEKGWDFEFGEVFGLREDWVADEDGKDIGS